MGAVFPPKEKIESIFSSLGVYNCLHYVDYRNEDGLRNSLAKAITYGGKGIDALQLDMTWPDPKEISEGVVISRREIEVILQIGKQAFEEIGNDPKALGNRLKSYQGAVDRVLLDKSMGKGVPMDAKSLIPFVSEVRNHLSDLGIGVAGGLGPETINLVAPLISNFPDLSIDAQGQLRKSGNIIDPIDWDLAKDYLINASKVLV